MLKPALAALALFVPLTAQSVAEGYASREVRLYPRSDRILVANSVTFAFDGRTLIAGTGNPVSGPAVLVLPNAVEAAFLVVADAGSAVLGERTNGEIWVAGASPLIQPRLAATVAGLRDGTLLDASRLLVSAARVGGTSIQVVDLVSGGIQTVIDLAGPPGAVDMAPAGLWVSRLDPSNPGAPASAQLLRFARQDILNAIGGTPLTGANAQLRASNLNPATEIAGDFDDDVFYIDAIDGTVREVSFGGPATSPVFLGADVWLPSGQPFVPAPIDLQFRGTPRDPRLPSSQFEAFQPETDQEMIVYAGDPLGGSRSARVFGTSRAATIVFPQPPAGTAFPIRIEDGPVNGLGLVALTPGRSLRELAVSVAGFEQIAWLEPALATAPVIPVTFGRSGTAALNLFNPGFSGGGFAVLTQCVFVDASGVVLGTSPPAEFVLR